MKKALVNLVIGLAYHTASAQQSLLFKLDLTGMLSLRASNEYSVEFEPAIIAAERGDYRKAVSEFSRLKAKHPLNLVVLHGWTASMVAAGREKELHRVYDQKSFDQVNHFIRGILYRSKWIREVKFDPNSILTRNADQYWLSFSRLLEERDAKLNLLIHEIERSYRLGAHDSRARIEQYIRRFGTNDELEVYRGYLYHYNSYNRGPKDDPNKPSPNRADNARALQIFDRVIRKRQDLPWAYFYRGVVLHRLGRKDEAVASMKRFRDTGPKDAKRMVDAVAYIKKPIGLSLLTSLGPIQNLPPGYTGDPPR